MEQLVYKIPDTIKDDCRVTFCPGCDHGLAIRLIAEVIDELGLKEKTIVVSSIGCSVFLDDYFDMDIVEAPHGRAMAVATGVKRAKPDKFVFTYQGDGDFAAIGMGESIHAAIRGENITAICVNNTTYGMTGGQAGPTTLLGQVTTTSVGGRTEGHPVKLSEMFSGFEGTAFVARSSLVGPKDIEKTKQNIKKAFQAQVLGKGTSLVEILATCPTNWRMSPKDSHKRVVEEMYPVFPMGVYKDRLED